MSVLRTTLTQALAGAALVTAALGATTSSAVADSVLLHDPATDSAAGADIQSVRVTHGTNLRVTVHHQNLVPSWRSNASGLVYVDTDPDRRGPELALSAGLMDGTDFALTRVRDWRRVGDQLTCRHSVRMDFETDTSVFVVGRGCLGADVDTARVAVRTGGNVRGDADDYDVDWLGGYHHLTGWVDRS
jgi:hypothetical protein